MNDSIQAIFAENIIGTLATADVGGQPRATALHVATDGQWVYWFSQEGAEHSRNIARDSRVSLCLFAADESRGLRGVYLAGRAEVLAADRERVEQLYAKRAGTFPAIFGTWAAYRLPLGTVDQQKSHGDCWYLGNN